jgi:hypothetical protein
MWLESPYGRVDLSRITPKAVVAKSPQAMPPCFADLIVVVDGERTQKRVNLPSGFRGGLAAMVRRVTEAAPF